MGVIDGRFPDYGERLNAYRLVADRLRLSERTVRDAFSRRPVTLRTAQRLAKGLGIDMAAFRIVLDRRGRPAKEGGGAPSRRRKSPKKGVNGR